MNNETKEYLEGLIDRHGLKVVLETLSEVCTLKDLHITETWQDFGLAEKWGKAGKALARVAACKAVDHVDTFLPKGRI